MQKSLEQLEQERRAASTIPTDKAPSFEALEKTVPTQQVTEPPSVADMRQVDKDFATDMQLADMLEVSMTDVADYRDEIEGIEQKRAGFVEKFFQDPVYKYPGWGKVIQGIDLTLACILACSL